MYFYVQWGGGKITLENGVSFNRNSMAVSRGEITIGEGTSIGPNVCIYDHDHFFDKDGFRKNLFKIGKVTIGKNCWIAANVTILRDTTIGDNSIIGAGVVLKGNIEPNSLVKSNREVIVEKLV